MPLNYNKTLEYRYEFRNGALVKVDQEGNLLSWGVMHPDTFIRLDNTERRFTSNSVPKPAEPMQTSRKPDDTDMEPDMPENPNSPVQEITSNDIPRMSDDELAKRDLGAIEYHNSLLTSGDTLVFVKYPQDGNYFNPAGLDNLNQPHRVHSSRLLATGSEKFKKLFEPTYQYRILRRLKLVNRLPSGVKYVLDLTPPDEGDEAVELTANLSCSYGIRMWHTANTRIGVSEDLVCGEDDIALAKNISQYGVPKPAHSTEPDFYDSSTASAAPDVLQNLVPNNTGNSTNSGWGAPSLHTQEDHQLDEAIALSAREAVMNHARRSNPHRDDVPEYCPIRHRAGIVRLLQVIEGKNPRLDFAPKVWTLFSIAHYFDCTSIIMDWIIQWTLADPNSQIIEILPEVCLKMAFGMKNSLLCRASFAVLVSEEAMSLTSRSLNKNQADLANTNQFGRFREEVDEDMKTRIEYASKAFNERVNKTFADLVEANWITSLPEYQKLQRFLDDIARYSSSEAAPVPTATTDRWLCAVNKLLVALRHFIRGRIVFATKTDIPNGGVSHELIDQLDRHRLAEQYKPHHGVSPFKLTYQDLDHKERLMTRFSWRTLRNIEFSYFHNYSTGLLLTTETQSSPLADLYDISFVSWGEIIGCTYDVNGAMLDAMKLGVFDGSNPSYLAFVNNSVNLMMNKRISEALDNPSKSEDSEDQLAMAVHSNALGKKLRQVAWSSNNEPGFNAHSTSSSMDTNGTVRSRRGPRSSAEEFDQYEDGKGALPQQTRPLPNLQPSQSTHDPWADNWSEMMGQLATSPPKIENWASGSNSYGKKSTSGQNSLQVPTTTLPLRTKFSTATQDPSDISLDKPFKASEQPEVNATSNKSGASEEVTNHHPAMFDLDEFFRDVQSHIRMVSDEMLNTSSFGIDVSVTDTLLCLSDEEFKYLPLWAGGDDDDSGGVFDQAIPAAMAGPNGPGPSFHTGYSNASAPSSEFGGFDSRSQITSINTSVGVEDGFSDHLDRRRVFSDSDIHSETFSEDSASYAVSNASNTFDRKGKGKAAAASFANNFTTSTAPSETGAEDMAMFNDGTSEAGTEMEFTTDSDFEVVDENYADDDDDAITTVGELGEEDNGMWDGGDDETFDFGDSDEDMPTI